MDETELSQPEQQPQSATQPLTPAEASPSALTDLETLKQEQERIIHAIRLKTREWLSKKRTEENLQCENLRHDELRQNEGRRLEWYDQLLQLWEEEDKRLVEIPLMAQSWATHEQTARTQQRQNFEKQMKLMFASEDRAAKLKRIDDYQVKYREWQALDAQLQNTDQEMDHLWKTLWEQLDQREQSTNANVEALKQEFSKKTENMDLEAETLKHGLLQQIEGLEHQQLLQQNQIAQLEQDLEASRNWQKSLSSLGNLDGTADMTVFDPGLITNWSIVNQVIAAYFSGKWNRMIHSMKLDQWQHRWQKFRKWMEIELDREKEILHELFRHFSYKTWEVGTKSSSQLDSYRKKIGIALTQDEQHEQWTQEQKRINEERKQRADSKTQDIIEPVVQDYYSEEDIQRTLAGYHADQQKKTQSVVSIAIWLTKWLVLIGSAGFVYRESDITELSVLFSMMSQWGAKEIISWFVLYGIGLAMFTKASFRK
ncbi:MAG: hypothetical protein HQM11_13295 [SAR324 cluster bacterium]|nr:hypothetical protein [SAR324 cluster bacterium]